MSSNLSFNDFINNFDSFIKTIERNHTDDTGTFQYGAGFNVVCKPNNRIMYFEHHLDGFDSNLNDSQIALYAWSNLIPTMEYQLGSNRFRFDNF